MNENLHASVFSVELFADGCVVNSNGIKSSAYTTDYAVYKISGKAIAIRRDFIITSYLMDALTCQYVTAWDENDNFLGSYGTVYNNDLPLKPNLSHDMLIRTSDYQGIDYLLLVVQKSVGMPTIRALSFDNLSYVPLKSKSSVSYT